MSRTLYVKYNRNRKVEFQTSTKICEDNGVKYVIKEGLNPQAIQHVKSMRGYFDLLNSEYSNVKAVECYDEKAGMRFEFIEGTSVKELLFDKLANVEKSEFLSYLSDIVKILFEKNSESVEFENTAETVSIFGEIDYEGSASSKHNIDMIFDNIILTTSGYVCLDYEWFFDVLIPDAF